MILKFTHELYERGGRGDDMGEQRKDSLPATPPCGFGSRVLEFRV